MRSSITLGEEMGPLTNGCSLRVFELRHTPALQYCNRLWQPPEHEHKVNLPLSPRCQSSDPLEGFYELQG
jgi:hypothetical protein